jgi:hypothetical protein
MMLLLRRWRAALWIVRGADRAVIYRVNIKGRVDDFERGYFEHVQLRDS